MSLNVLQVIDKAGRELGLWAASSGPTAREGADALVAFNAVKRALFGTLIGPRLSPIGLSGTSGQAENGGEYQIPGGASFTLAAPANPRSGDRFGVVDAGLAWGSFPLSVAPNGRLLGGAAIPTTINVAGQNTRWWFRGDTGNWLVEADSASLNSAIEFPDPIISYLPFMLAVAMAGDFGADIPPAVAALAQEGRAVIARSYGRRGRGAYEKPIGLAAPAAVAAQG